MTMCEGLSVPCKRPAAYVFRMGRDERFACAEHAWRLLRPLIDRGAVVVSVVLEEKYRGPIRSRSAVRRRNAVRFPVA